MGTAPNSKGIFSNYIITFIYITETSKYRWRAESQVVTSGMRNLQKEAVQAEAKDLPEESEDIIFLGEIAPSKQRYEKDEI